MNNLDTLATQRLIDASAALDASDRALLNIWVNQSLDDERLAFLTGTDIKTLGSRKGRLVGRLADELGDPAPEVRAALEQIAANTREAKVRSDGEVATVGPDAAPSAEQPDDRPGESSAATEQPAPERGGGRPAPWRGGGRPAPWRGGGRPAAWRGGGRQRGVIAALAALVLAAAVIEIAVAPSGGSQRRVVSDRPTAAAPPRNAALATPSAAHAPPVTATPSKPSTPGTPAGLPTTRSIRRLAPLPGIRTNLEGSLGLNGAGPDVKLKFRLRVPASGRGHYEVWLYNSILDSRALGVPQPGTHTALYRLPSDAARYRWIDISFQPPGATSHSGESRLRAANPTYARPAQ